MNIKKVSLTITAFLIPVLCSAQQTPLITVHNDDKPPYISPFDKPSHAAALESTAQSFSFVKSPLPNKESNTPATTISPTVPQENTARKPEPEIKKSEPVKKQTRSGGRNRQKYRNSHSENSANSDSAAGIAKLPNVSASSEAITLVPKNNLVTMPVAITPTVDSTLIQPITIVRAPTMQNTQAGKEIAPLTVPNNLEGSKKTQVDMTPHDVAKEQQLKSAAVIHLQTPPLNSVTSDDAKMNMFNDMSKIVIGLLIMLLATIAYGVKRTIFRKDPALTDPWFKPAK